MNKNNNQGGQKFPVVLIQLLNRGFKVTLILPFLDLTIVGLDCKDFMFVKGPMLRPYSDCTILEAKFRTSTLCLVKHKDTVLV